MLIARFIGEYRLDRVIDDARTGQVARFEGQASIRMAGPGGAARYEEAGEMILPAGDRLRASRTYLWRETRGQIHVFFDDGRPFHGFDPQAPMPAAEHRCDPDTYRVAYDFSDWPVWTATWASTAWAARSC